MRLWKLPDQPLPYVRTWSNTNHGKLDELRKLNNSVGEWKIFSIASGIGALLIWLIATSKPEEIIIIQPDAAKLLTPLVAIGAAIAYYRLRRREDSIRQMIREFEHRLREEEAADKKQP